MYCFVQNMSLIINKIHTHTHMHIYIFDLYHYEGFNTVLELQFKQITYIANVCSCFHSLE